MPMLALLTTPLSWLISFAKTPLGRYVIGTIIVVAAILFYGNYRYNEGASDKDAEYQKIIQEERTRLEEANRLALEEAEKRLEELRRTLEARNAQLKDIVRQAGEDPDATLESLGPSSLRRLNRID